MNKKFWNMVLEQAKKMYEEDCGGDWEEADKYEVQDYNYAAYLNLKEKKETLGINYIDDITVKELKASAGYEFECNIDKETKKEVKSVLNNPDDEYEEVFDEWGAALVWYGENIGAEYNLCVQNNGENSSAIYRMEFNKEEDSMETDYDDYVHYEIDFSDRNWKRKLENAMCEALLKFYGL